MPPEPVRDAIVIVLDVGKSVSNLNYWEDKTFFEQSRDCVSWIIQRKLISQSKDILSLLLIGSDTSHNAVTAPDYKNISCKYDFQLASWDMLKFIKNEVEATDQDSDWIGGLVVATEMLKEYEKLDNIQNKKIVFFSDFTHPASDDLDIIAKKIKSLSIEITIIGPTYISLTSNDEEVQMPPEKRPRLDNDARRGRSRGEKLVSELWNKLPNNIGICGFETALKQLNAYIRKPVRKTPWNCLLDIGDVRINISMFKKTDPKPAKKFVTKCLRDLTENESDSNRPGFSQHSVNLTPDDVASTVRDKVMSYKHELGHDSGFVDVQVQPEDTVEGFRYGATIIPFTEEDKKILQYKSGPKSFSVIGFTSISSVPYYLLSGEKSYFVIAKDSDEHAEVALSAFIQAMKEMEVLAIVRRVYSNDSGLSLGILYPVIEEIISDESEDEVLYKEYLLFVELAFEEEIKAITFPSLEPIAKNLSEKQLEAIDNLIEGMDLMKADKGFRGEPCEAFEITKLHDFKEQFFHYCQVQRGLYPENPLPTSLPSYIEDYIKTPVTLESKIKFLIKEIKEQFKIEIDKKKIDEEKNVENDNEKCGVMDSSSSSVVSAGEKESDGSSAISHFERFLIEKENDSIKRGWMERFSKGFPSDDELDRFLGNVNDEEKSNLLKCFQQVLTVVRRKHLGINPDMYNCWIEKLKAYTHTRTEFEVEMWNVVVNGDLGLITIKENEFSRVTEEEGEEFMYKDVTESLQCLSPKQKKTDFEPDRDNLGDLRAEQMGVESLF